MRDASNDSEIAEHFRTYADTAFPRAPLNSALCRAIAHNRSLASLLTHAPIEQQLSVLLLACIHSLVLDEPDHRLADWYPNLTVDHRAADDPALPQVLAEFVDERTLAMLELLRTRRVQTNEVGRCAILLPGLASVGAEVGTLSHIDVGASAGLNTLLGHYSYRYDGGPVLGSGSPLMECSTRGDGPTPTALPDIAASRGIDISPIDVGEADDARWLMACCWPDQIDRFERLAAAIDIAQRNPPTLVAGDAVDMIAPTIADVSTAGHPVLTSSWVMNYLEPSARVAFVDQLDQVAQHKDLSWVFAEAPALTPELPHVGQHGEEHTTALAIVRWRAGRRTVEHLGICHPHGYWLHWH